MTRALALHHDVNSTLGLLGPILAARGIDVVEHTVCAQLDQPHSAGPLPTLAAIDLFILMGSRWSVYEAGIEEWIHDELELIRSADATGVPVLGLCFGGQALAAALGGQVTCSPLPEVGWVEIASAEPAMDGGPWFAWHFDRFEPPPEADTTATNSAACQAFRLRRNLGLQFHPELDTALLELWMESDRDQLVEAGIDPDRLLADTRRNEAAAGLRTARLVDWFLAEVAGLR